MNKTLYVIIVFLLIGCSSSLLTRRDYQPSLKSFRQNSPQKALETFPRGEPNSFITSIEKAYLNLIQGKPKIDDLQKHAEILENRVRYKVSREIKSLFYVKTPEGYYASEHEVVWLHLLLSWGYSLRGEYEKGCVEARKSAHLLNAPWSEEGGFDDPTLRVFLGVLWAMCGSWDEARVDFRAARLLDPSLDWAERLANLESPPKNLIVILGGVGPVVRWDPKARLNPLRGWRSLVFKTQGKRSAIQIQDSGGDAITPNISPDSSPWYTRHFARDNEIQDLIQDSHYGGESLATVTVESAKMAAGVTTGALIAAGSIGLAFLILKYGSSSSRSGEAALGIAVGGSVYGVHLAVRTVEDSVDAMRRDLDPSDTYRFARFLPEYIWVSRVEKDFKAPLKISLYDSEGKRKIIDAGFQIFVHGNSRVWLGNFPDTRDVSLDSPILDAGEKWKKWSGDLKKTITRMDNGKGWKMFRNMLKEIYALKGEKQSFGHNMDYSLSCDGMTVRIERKKGMFYENQAILINLDSKKINPDSMEIFSFLKESARDFSGMIKESLRWRLEYLQEQAKKEEDEKGENSTAKN